ncbi:kinase-like domain-containing protein [Myxozyma melibiosi]|uniref:Kinase-like domain-containing protein n=1 Tax=Myxozyma melibiosi TaxID=54550 RepID=A0ABR1F538_9ASCO
MNAYTNITFLTTGASSKISTAANSTGETVILKISSLAAQRVPHSPLRERALLRALGGRRNIVALLSAFTNEDDEVVLVLPFLPVSLSEFACRNAEVALKRSITRDITAAIAYLHERGVIHRDIKPQNILLKSASGPAYLTDFGTAWVAPSSDLCTAAEYGRASVKGEAPREKVTDVGTGVYRAPELLFGYTAYGAEVDLWSWGCVLAEVYGEGRRIFEVDDELSEFALVRAIFETLGTPDLESWPEARKFPAFSKFRFVGYPTKPLAQVLRTAPEEAVEVVASLLRYESSRRESAKGLLSMRLFSGFV